MGPEVLVNLSSPVQASMELDWAHEVPPRLVMKKCSEAVGFWHLKYTGLNILEVLMRKSRAFP